MRSVLLGLLLLLSPLPLHAALLYQGEQTLWQDTVWEGEVTVDGILTVAPEVRLEIRPGTVVRLTFHDSNNDGIGENEIFIQGVLDARGTAEQPIRFTAAGEAPFPGYWGALNMMASESGNILEHCIVEYGYRGFHAHFGQAQIRSSLFRRNLRGLQFQDSTVSMVGCSLEDNFNGIQFRESTVLLENCRISGGEWGVRCVYSDLTVNGCLIEQNRLNGISLRDSKLQLAGSIIRDNRKGVYLQRSQGSLSRCLIAGNAEHGTFFEDSDVELLDNRITGNGRAAVRWLDSSGLLRGNDLADNGEYAIINDGKGDLTAAANWWGSDDPQQIERLIRDGADRPGCGSVDASAPLATPADFIVPAEPFSSVCIGE